MLFVLEALLGLAHLRWPELEWGQGRDSYFNLGNRLTLASWLAAMQLVAVAGLCMFMFHRAAPQRADAPRGVWRLGAIAALLLSLHEITRFVERFGWLGGQQPDPFERMIPGMGGLIVVALFGVSLRRRLVGRARALITGWLGLWALERVLVTLPIEGVYVGLARGLAWLAGGTLLLLALLEHASRHRADARPPAHDLASAPRPRSASALELVGVGGTTFCLIALQIVLFQLLTISGDYLLANSVISIALLGLALGGLIGFSAASRAPRQAVLTASFLLPAAVLLAFGVSASMMGSPLLASALLAVPFTLCSAVITVKLVEADTHTVYFFDLAGAALGALVVAPGFGLLREEGSMLLLAALAFLVALLFARTEPRGPSRAGLSALALLGALALTAATVANARVDALNVVRERVLKDYPRAELLFSRSSFAGRYDVVRRRPSSEALKSLENGHTIDTIRPDPPARYQIDPRVPHTLMPDPVVLILGVSGDAITKTARQLASVVYGVEINPVVVELQRGPLAPLNGDSYDGIDVEPVDGRSYLERYPERRYDMITLLNAHFARGRAGGRAPCPEYLHTQDAFARYLDQLTDRGVVILEEPVTRPEREVAIWKLLETMRAALLERGAARPDEHFFVFQWNTRTNNYVQILMKKTPFTPEELARLEDWLAQVNSLPALERERGQSLGPIDTAACTTLFAPHQPDGDDFQNTYATILRGQTDPRLRRARRLTPTRDDRPFPFDTDPARPAVRAACARALALLLCLLPAFWALLRRVSSRAGVVAPYALVVALTGVGYFLVEVVLIQRHEFLLGSPVVTFSTVLGSLLAFSGLGSLWSRRLSTRGLLWALGAVIALLGAHLLWPVPALLNAAHGLALPLKVLLSVSAIAPLAFFMGAPFPTIMRLGKRRFTPAGAAALFAVNAAASAVAVPVTMALSMNYGFSTTFALGALAYALVGALALTLGRERGAPLITTLAAAALA
ncbi:MAG: hypothetical protein KC468_36995, partial [Myxococcales bacterium]|nr:hypothetical protein [Myxococcales bacterium]